MLKSSPCHNFLAESTNYPLELFVRRCSYNFYCDVLVAMRPLPYVRKPTVVKRNALSIIAGRNSERFRNYRVATTRLAQNSEALLPDPWREVKGSQCLLAKRATG